MACIIIPLGGAAVYSQTSTIHVSVDRASAGPNYVPPWGPKGPNEVLRQVHTAVLYCFFFFFFWSFSQTVAKQFRAPVSRVLNKFDQTASRSLPCCACAETLPEWRLSRFALRPPPGVSVSAHPRGLGDSSDGVSVSAGQLRQRGAASGVGNLLLRAGAGRGGAAWKGHRAGFSQVRWGLGSGLTLASLSTQFTTTVVSCRPAELHTEESNGKKEVLSGFQVVLEDTLLFPEGGGQVPGPSRSPPLPSLPRKPSIPFSPSGKCLFSLSLSCNEYSWN